ncbi:hypothetical protein OSG_eHP28_00130 [environmental Halophage eHP-28]|nr:hypothetical protein OSG_eHP28_00130 [environmental Halophage eHP-28]
MYMQCIQLDMDIPESRPSPEQVADKNERETIEFPDGTMLKLDGTLYKLDSAELVIKREALWAAGDVEEPTAHQQLTVIEAETESHE